MIYKNWKDLKPLTQPVPVGTKVVCLGGGYFDLGEVLTVAELDKNPYCVDEDGVKKAKSIHNLALLPQSTMTEQEKWQFGDIDLDACECVEHEGRRYPWVDTEKEGKRILLFVIGDCALCVDSGRSVSEALSTHGRHTRSFKTLTPIPKKQPPKTVAMTQDDVLALLRKGGVELGDGSEDWVSGSYYKIHSSGVLSVNEWNYKKFTHYRSQETNWEPKPLTKVVD